jgi:hypothetical protein
MLTKPEIYMIANSYIGVKHGYLGDFSYKTHAEFYPYFCNINIKISDYKGTTREKFLKILENSERSVQAKILRGVLMKYPVNFFPEEVRPLKQEISEKIESLIRQLENLSGVSSEKLIITNETVERAISDTKVLLERNGATSGVDRIHTALHGYLKEVCKQGGIDLADNDNLTQVFKKLKTSHPKLNSGEYKQNDINQIISSFSNTLDKLNPIRNKASLSHPNEELLGEDEAMLVIDSAHTVLNYLNRKFKK